MSTKATATQLLDVAQHMVQERGFNAFSYKDLSEAVGIRTASIHYHYKGKAELGKALMDRYRARLDAQLTTLDAGSRTAKARLRGLIQMYRDTEATGLACLCGSFATDIETLPEELAEHVRGYLQRTQSWVESTLKEGVASGEFEPIAKASDLAASLLASLQGGLFLSRATGQSRLDAVQRSFFKALGS